MANHPPDDEFSQHTDASDKASNPSERSGGESSGPLHQAVNACHILSAVSLVELNVAISV